MEPAIRIRGLSKRFQLGVFNRQTLQDEVAYWWHRLRGRDPHARMGRVTSDPPGGKPRHAGNEELWALRDVTFDVQPGEVVGIIGSNGAGKTTLLKILTRITAPTEGEAEMNGRVGSLLEVGTGFHPELTGRENTYLNGAILGMSRSEVAAKFDDIVEFAGIGRFIDTPVKRYSSGMYVRLAFAVAAHLDPEILLIDEVLAVGDASFQRQCLGKMGNIARSGRTILFVSHNMGAIRRLCDRTVWIEAGKVREIGDTQDVVMRYLEASSAERGGTDGVSRTDAFTRWYVTSEEKETHTCVSGRAAEVSFEFTTRRTLRGVYAGIALWTADGVLVWAESTRHLLDVDELQPGRHRLRLRLGPLPLRAGSYALEVSLNTRDEQVDRWHALPMLKIVEERPSEVSHAWKGICALECRPEFMSVS